MSGLVVQWLACRSGDREVAGSTPGQCTARQQLWASCQHPCASVTKQYNLVPVKGRWCSAAGKVTVGLASHWPCGTDFSGHLQAHGQGKGDEHPTYAHWGMVRFTFLCSEWWRLVVVVWLNGNVLGHINEVTLHRAGLVLRWVTHLSTNPALWRWPFAGIPSWCSTKPPRPTQPGHPSVHSRNEYWRWLRLPL